MHSINRYPVDSALLLLTDIRCILIYPLDSVIPLWTTGPRKKIKVVGLICKKSIQIPKLYRAKDFASRVLVVIFNKSLLKWPLEDLANPPTFITSSRNFGELSELPALSWSNLRQSCRSLINDLKYKVTNEERGTSVVFAYPWSAQLSRVRSAHSYHAWEAHTSTSINCTKFEKTGWYMHIRELPWAWILSALLQYKLWIDTPSSSSHILVRR